MWRIVNETMQGHRVELFQWQTAATQVSFMWLVFIHSCSLTPLEADCPRLPSIESSTIVADCLFEVCALVVDSTDGGALYLSDPAFSITILSSRFVTCQSLRDGGGFYMRPCPSFSMNESSGINCSAAFSYSFGTGSLESAADGTLDVHRDSIF
jgi:hypothetical protein